MKVGRRERHVTQRWDLELVLVARIVGHVEPSQIGWPQRAPGEVVLHLAHRLEGVAADVGTLMAGDAAQRDERFVAALLDRGQRRSVALQAAIEGRVRRDERALELGERDEKVALGDAVGKGAAEQRSILAVPAE